jgi:hypothetical protein
MPEKREGYIEKRVVKVSDETEERMYRRLKTAMLQANVCG